MTHQEQAGQFDKKGVKICRVKDIDADLEETGQEDRTPLSGREAGDGFGPASVMRGTGGGQRRHGPSPGPGSEPACFPAPCPGGRSRSRSPVETMESLSSMEQESSQRARSEVPRRRRPRLTGASVLAGLASSRSSVSASQVEPTEADSEDDAEPSNLTPSQLMTAKLALKKDTQVFLAKFRKGKSIVKDMADTFRTLSQQQKDALEHDHEEVMGWVQRARDSLSKLAAKIAKTKSPQHWAALKESIRAATADLEKADSFAKEHLDAMVLQTSDTKRNLRNEKASRAYKKVMLEETKAGKNILQLLAGAERVQAAAAAAAAPST